MFYELALDYKGKLHNFTPFYSKEGLPAWTSLPQSLTKEIITLGEQYLDFSFESLPATSFMAFIRTGNRTDYEELYFNKRRAINALVMAECVEKKNRFMDSIINGIFSICEESAWQLPAHNSYERNSIQFILPDSTRPVLDLFACETGALLSLVSYLMQEELHAISPTLLTRIKHELNFRIIEPYLNTHAWWMGKKEEPMCNWTVWCTQNILITASLLDLPKEIKHIIFLKASKSIDYFLKDYGEDGCCDEGAQYYRHAGLCLFQAMEILNSVSNQHFKDLYDNPKIKNIASYILNIHVGGEYYINFADCSPIAGRAGVREFLFGKATNNPALMQFASTDFKEEKENLLPLEINLFYRIQLILTWEEILSYEVDSEILHPDIYYESVGVFKVQDATMCLAVKAGDNNDSHNHNDVGSFTIYKHQKPLFIDVGVESYSKKTFSPNRYDIWTMQSSYHNLPEIDSTMQKNGANYKAIHVKTKMEDKKASISMDIAPAYPLANLEYYKRSVIHHKNKSIIIKDTWSGCQHVVLNLMTYEKPIVCSNHVIEIGTLAKTYIEGAKKIEVEEISILDKRLQTAWKHSIYRIKITASQQNLKLTIE